MKKTAFLLTLIACLTLSACGAKPPEKTAEGEAWSRDWTTVGNLVGVEPEEGWTVQRNEDMLASSGTFYASWSWGEAVPYTNESGDEITAYDAQIHLVVMECDTPADAEQAAGQWQSIAQERYPEMEQSTGEYAGRAYQISTYPFPADNGPASLGASATLQGSSLAFRVDVVTLEDFERSPSQVLADFLERCHFAQR